MRKCLIVAFFIFGVLVFASGQSVQDSLVSKCLHTGASKSKHIKDFRIELGPGNAAEGLRFKATVSLWKKARYRFISCTDDNSKGKLIVKLTDNLNNVLVSSVDKKTGAMYPYVDFRCRKSGIYNIYYDFNDGQPGSGVGIISLLK